MRLMDASHPKERRSSMRLMDLSCRRGTTRRVLGSFPFVRVNVVNLHQGGGCYTLGSTRLNLSELLIPS